MFCLMVWSLSKLDIVSTITAISAIFKICSPVDSELPSQIQDKNRRQYIEHLPDQDEATNTERSLSGQSAISCRLTSCTVSSRGQHLIIDH